ncbi:MAG: ribonuclease R [Oscillospiraceae bacterium]|nr:ribonuclease R [Oscillospiraceae bacterium]
MARHNAKHQARKNLKHNKKSGDLSKLKSKAKLKSQQKRIRPGELETCCRKIRTFLELHKKLSRTELAQKCRSHRNPQAYQAALEELRKKGEILERGKYYVLADQGKTFRAETIRLHAHFGFIRDENDKEYFVAGKFLAGSLKGDVVLARAIPSRSGSPEAEILSILEESQHTRIAGRIVPTEAGLCLLSDIAGMPLHIDYKESCPYKINDQVLCEVISRGSRHMDHKVKVILNFGDCDNAQNCMRSRIAAQEIPVDFPEKVRADAKKAAAPGVTEFDLQGRLDLREEIIFTIDGAHSKDLDDAVSIRKHPDGYWTLGVHIADVSHYVRPNSPLDSEAFRRGTSIYYADEVIPMLPKALSNGICSLNAGYDRLTLSAILELSPEGDLIQYEFHKSVIHSKVRGVYEECNAILEHSADAELMEKYAPVLESLELLEQLSEKLEILRKRRGAPELESTESVLLLDQDGICTGLAPVQRGRTERIIESCMLCANEAAAKLAREKKFPFVYRVHENPAPERIVMLREMLIKLGISQNFGDSGNPEEIKPCDIQTILDQTRDLPCFPVINNLTLRSMAKAKYSEIPKGHFGLALRDYTHFTSPIRRYSDLVVHRILSDYLDGAEIDWLIRRYGKFTENAAERASMTELRAVQLEREADACYAAEFMKSHTGEIFDGVITSVTEFGMYVQLSNMAEGLLHIHDMPPGEYFTEENWFFENTLTGERWQLGDPIRVVCLRADVCTGHIDLGLA